MGEFLPDRIKKLFRGPGGTERGCRTETGFSLSWVERFSKLHEVLVPGPVRDSEQHFPEILSVSLADEKCPEYIRDQGGRIVECPASERAENENVRIPCRGHFQDVPDPSGQQSVMHFS